MTGAQRLAALGARGRALEPDPEALRRYAARARGLVEEDAARRRAWLQARLWPRLPGLGPLAGGWEAAGVELTLERHQWLLAWLLSPARSQELAQAAWAALQAALWPEAPLPLGAWEALRVSPEAGGEPWGSLDVFAWNPQGRWGMGLALSLEAAQSAALDARLDHYVQRAHRKFGEDAVERTRWVRVTPRGEPPHSAWGTRRLWRTVSWARWRELWRSLGEAPGLEPAQRLEAARYAQLVEGQVLTPARICTTLRQNLERDPGQRLLCAMQRAWYQGPR